VNPPFVLLCRDDYMVHCGVRGFHDPAIRPLLFSKAYRADAKRRGAYAAMTSRAKNRAIDSGLVF